MANECRRAASAVGRLVVDGVYFTLLLPFGLFTRWFRDPLSIKNLPAEWLDRPDEKLDIGSARKP
ncbi:MAG TPA: hypothetical protein VMH00_12285 [Candidatus Limnocylindrales bacterium]|nr:hypothetical protein [Candidatus Limnocylindrales bacterium]